MTDSQKQPESGALGIPEGALAALLQAVPPVPPLPLATYRVQLNKDFSFKDAERTVPYLAELGIGALYTSPYLKAHPGSMHGYDVTDYGALNPKIGTDADYEALVAALRERALGLVVDFVPNHMGIAHGANPWWQDVLENGQTSAYATFFDIDWRPLKPELRNKVLLPVLGDHYGAVLENGELHLRYADGAFTVWYHDLPLPIAPPTYAQILRHPLDGLTQRLAADDGNLLEYQSIITAVDRLPPQDERDPERVVERRREQGVVKRRLADLLRSAPEIETAVAAAARVFTGTPAAPRSFDPLDRLLEAQSYRLAFWRVAAEEINYRRFFAINELAAIRQEVPEVFAASHALLLRQIGADQVTGVRIDHPDGLWDPAGYYRHLQRGTFVARCRAAFERAPRDALVGVAWTDFEASLGEWWDRQPQTGRDRELSYVVVEKILEPGEELPPDWLVSGTVGYEFARVVTGLFVDSAHRKLFDDLYARYTAAPIRFADLVYENKKLIMRVALASEVNVLAQSLNRISEQDRRTRDFTLNSLRDALREIIACFPVYRTYALCAEGVLAQRDRRSLETAVALAKRRNPATDISVFDFVADVLLLHRDGTTTEEQWAERCQFGMKFQQLTGPVMAKGLEDTALYIHNRLASLNEVGGDPTAFGVPAADFHRQNADRRKRWPHALLASSTHDTKRSEDVRARIDVLSELPREWRAALNRWTRLNRGKKTRVDGAPAPDRNDEYLCYQTLLGVWPFGESGPDGVFTTRIVDYMLKAAREAQIHTSWINPNQGYDDALAGFVRAALDASARNPFLDDFTTLRRRVAHVGVFNALSQQLLKLTSPGVPDIYQGTELWDFSLVDPDNRRPVDYGLRARLLRDLRRKRPSRRLAETLLATMADGRIKLWVTFRALQCRQARPELFSHGEYVPLDATGKQRDHVVAFARRAGDGEIVAVVPRLVAGLTRGESIAPVGVAVWGDTRLPLAGVAPGTRYRDAFTGEVLTADTGRGGTDLALSDVLAAFPVALLERLPATPAEEG